MLEDTVLYRGFGEVVSLVPATIYTNKTWSWNWWPWHSMSHARMWLIKGLKTWIQVFSFFVYAKLSLNHILEITPRFSGWCFSCWKAWIFDLVAAVYSSKYFHTGGHRVVPCNIVVLSTCLKVTVKVHIGSCGLPVRCILPIESFE